MIDIDQLSEEELIDLNHRIVERLNFLSQARAHEKMLKFRVGERVQFESNAGQTLSGVLMKYNKKTVSILTDEGQRWNVAPGFLKSAKIQSAGASEK
jgi:hypothetical protein